MSQTTTPLLAALAAGALLLTGCSSVEEQSQAAAASDAAMPTSPEAQAAQQDVDRAGLAVETFEAPGDPVSGVEDLAGTTVYFVPATYQVPVFQALAHSLEDALDAAGITLEVCDGKSNPANMASCMQQGIDAGAGAIVTGSIPQDLASVAFESARRAGIPVVNTMTAPAGPGDPREVAYLTPDYIGLQSLSASSVIAASDAAAESSTSRSPTPPPRRSGPSRVPSRRTRGTARGARSRSSRPTPASSTSCPAWSPAS